MATTTFKGPINSVGGYQFNGLAQTPGATRIIMTAGKGSLMFDAGVAGLTTVKYGIAQHVTLSASKTFIVVRPYASAASFQVVQFFSSSATVRNTDGDSAAGTVDVLLIGT